MSLTPKQAAVVENPFANKLVCALPGSGKTHTMISLSQNILNHPGTTILQVTFTNAATNEMLHRVQSRLGPLADHRVKVKTFAKIMIEQHKPLLAGRKLILGGELQVYAQRVFKKLNIAFENHKLFMEAFEQYGCDLNWQHKPGIATSDAYIELQNLLSMYGRIDLNTVAKEVVFGLEAGKLKPLNFTHFLVDEFQDSDEAQYRWLLAHKHPSRYFTVVGDDDQSIYGWRGAVGYENMLKFKRDFQAMAYTLDTCFRCAPFILGTAQKLIEHNQARIPKDMHASKKELGHFDFLPFTIPELPKEEGQSDKQEKPPKLTPEQKQELEYGYIVDFLGPNYASWTVLARTNLQLDTLEAMLSKRGIPAHRLGGKSIFDSPDVIALVKLIFGLTHPKNINPVIEGLGWLGECEDTLQSVHAIAKTHGFSSASLHHASPYTEKLQQISLSLQNRSRQDDGNGFLKQIFYAIEDAIGSSTETGSKSGSFNVKMKMGAVSMIERIISSMNGTIEQRSRSLHDLATKGSQDNNKPDTQGRVILCTLTSAKGLEWPKVLIINVNSGSIPTIKPEDLDQDGCPNQQKIEEERRLLYVGMTRAEDELYLHYNTDKPSQFIYELMR